ncbi:hypothetical protein BY458DRAFT_535488 [Sporodiniella umbellata]|nr:hypothetical protein BY458DRAFT_535488 [Sporodiniella umbellata]
MIFLGELLCILFIHLATRHPSLLDQSFLDAVQPHHGFGNDWAAPQTTTWPAALWFILPSACDLIATTLLNLGLIYTTPSVYQMIKGSIIGFSAIFSALFLARKFLRKEWFAIVSILVGTGIIVLSILNHASYWGPVFLIVAQLFVAAQFIMEEYLMDRYQLDAVRAMGIESVFGAVVLGLVLLLAAFFGEGSLDVSTGFRHLFAIPALWQSALLLAFMVAIFNFFGLAITTFVGIPGRSIIDFLRTVLAWVVAIYYGWDIFSWVELLGFSILLFGVFVFNGVFKRNNLGSEGTPLLS